MGKVWFLWYWIVAVNYCQLIADICFQNAQYAANQLNKIKGLLLHHNNREFLKEFVLEVPFSAAKFILDAEKEGFLVSKLPGDSSDSLLLLAFTEKRTNIT